MRFQIARALLAWVVLLAPGVAPPATAQPPESAEAEEGFALQGPVRRSLFQLQEEWDTWQAAAIEGDEDAADTAVDSLLLLAGEFGVTRLPDLSSGTAALAVQFAAAGELDRARLALQGAERLDPGRAETARAAAKVWWLGRSYHRWVGSNYEWVLRALGNPAERLNLLTGVVIWLFYFLLVSAGVFVGLLMATRGRELYGNLVDSLGRIAPDIVAQLLSIAVLIWPLFLPAGLLWLLAYWSLLIWGYSTRGSRVVLVVCWLLLGAAPVVVDELSSRVTANLSSSVRALEELERGALLGSIFNDLHRLQSDLVNSVAVHQAIADVHFMLGEWESAGTFYQDVLDYEPENVAALVGAGACQMQLGNIDSATEYLNEASAGEAGPAEAYFNLSQIYNGQYRFAEARTALEQARNIDDSLVSALIRSGNSTAVAPRGGVSRIDEIREEQRRKWETKEVGWSTLLQRMISLPLAVVFLFIAAALQLLHRQSAGRSVGATSEPGGAFANLCRALIPGLSEMESGWTGAALGATMLPVALATLPAAKYLGYRQEALFPSSATVPLVISGVGLAIYFGIRVVRYLRSSR